MGFSNNAYQFAITAKNQTEKTFNKIDSDLRGINLSVKNMAADMRKLAGPAAVGVAALGTATAGVIVAAVDQTADLAAEVQNLSRIANASNEELQEMAYGARLLGVEQDSLADIMKDVNDKVGDFIQTGGGAMKDFFEQIAPKVGVTANQFRELSGPDALQLYVSSLEKANLSQSEMTFYMEAIASDATALIPLLKDGGAAMNEQAEEARQLGLILSGTDIALLEETDRQLKRSKESFSAFTKQLALEFAPLITAVSNEFLNSAKEAGGFGQVATSVFDAVISAAGYTANVIRGLEAVWHGIKYVVADVMEGTLSLFETIETGYRLLLDLIPGVEVESEAVLTGIRESFTNVKESIANDLKEAVNTPLPADSIAVWAEEVKSQAQEVAATVAAAKNGQQGDDAEAANDISFEDDPEVIAAMAKMDHLNLLKDLQLETDREREELAHLERLEKLQERFEGEELPMLMEYKALKEQLELKHQENLLKIENKGAHKRAQFSKKTMAAQTKQVFGELASITAGVASHNKDLFNLNKAAGIATAIVNTYKGVSESLAAYPMPIAAVMAAAHLAAGMAQVNAIKSQQFGGGGGSASASITGGTTAVGTTPITNAPSNIASEPAANESARDQRPEIHLSIDPSAKYDGEDVRELIEDLAREVGYGASFT